MDKIFWNSFLEDTDNFKKPFIKKNAFDNINEFKTLVYTSLKNMTNEEQSPYGIWIDGDNRNELKEHITKGINNYKDIDSFSNNFFENHDFGIVAHHTNAYNEDLATKMHEILFPLNSLLGIGIKGIDLNLFLGNYGWTPFGIHQDGIGENVIHFHLGPANKKMYLWSPEVYSKIENESLETKISNSEYVFDISPGDLFFMPHGYFHIGYTPEYSIGLTTWFCFPTYTEVRQKIFNDMIKELNKFYKKGEETTPIYNINSDFNDSDLKNVFIDSEFNFIGKIALDNVFMLYLNRHMLKLKSSLFYTWPILILKDHKKFNDEFFKLPIPYKIYTHYMEETKALFIYIKGYEFIYYNITDIENIQNFIEQINNREQINITNISKDYIKNIMNDILTTI